MPPEEVVEEVVEQTAEPVDERRAAIEAAFDEQQEEPSEPAKPAGLPPAPEAGDPTKVAKETAKPVVEAVEDPGSEGSPQDKPIKVDRAPQAWRAPTKAKWEALDPEVKQEVMRREREVTKVLSDSAQARQVMGTLQQTIAPYSARLHSMNADPMKAVGEMLKADYLLATGPKRQKAELIAKFIKDYEVDVVELDGILSGQQRQPSPTDGVEQLLQQRLAPFEQYLNQQRAIEVARKQAEETAMQQSIENMAVDPAYPHFEAIRDTMADLIEISARKGVPLSLKECYNKALAMDPRMAAELAASAEKETKAKLVAERNTRAQRAKQASSSVSGAPSVVRVGAPADRRALIEAAFDAQGQGG